MKITSLLSKIQARDNYLVIDFSTGEQSRFHWIWLRDNCLCQKCHHPQTLERVVDTWSLDTQIASEDYKISDSGTKLQLTWPDGHLSEYSSVWLRSHSYDTERVSDGLPDPTPWSVNSLKSRPSISAQSVLESDQGTMTFIRQLREFGFSIVTDLSPDEGMVEKLAKRIGFLRETHFGVDFTVESKPDPNNVAYTAIELKAHTDLPNLEMPPGIQFLHCLHFEAQGGESILVDGFAVAEQLKKENPTAFDNLTRIPVLYRFLDKEWDLRWHSPAIRLDHNGQLEEIRYHTALTGALDTSFDDMEALYNGLRAFTEILRRPEYELKFKLMPGEVMVFQNRRVLHGRAAFDPQSGPRKLRGCYVDCDQAWSKFRVLQGLNKL